MSGKKIEVLKELRWLARVVAFYNRENFKVTNSKIWWQNVISAGSLAILLILLLFLYAAAILHCFNSDFRVSATAFAIPTSLCILQVFVIYISLAIQNRQIAESIQRIQKVIEKREIVHLIKTQIMQNGKTS